MAAHAPPAIWGRVRWAMSCTLIHESEGAGAGA